MTPGHRVYLALGSNVDSARNYRQALLLLRELGEVPGPTIALPPGK